MGQAKRRGNLDERIAVAGDRPAKESKAEARRRQMLERREVPDGYLGIAVLERGVLLAVHHFPVADFAEGRAIVSTGAVGKMKGILRGDPSTDLRAFHYLRHAGFDRLRAHQHAGFGFLLWTVVNDHQVGPEVAAFISTMLSEKGRGTLMLVAADGKLEMIVGDEFPGDLEKPDQAQSGASAIYSVPLTYDLR
jgi:hypothetical protein